MTGSVIIVSRAGTKYAVHVVPRGQVDHDQALPSYSKALAYAGGILATLGNARLDDRCEGHGQ